MTKQVGEIKERKRLERGTTARQTMQKRTKHFPFEGEWEEAFSSPEAKGIWIVWGKSGNGKSSFVMQLTKYLCQWERALFFSLEEGRSGTLKASIKRHGLEEVGKRVLYYSTTDFEEIKEIIRSHPHRKVIVIDSLQYLGIEFKHYKAFKAEFADRTVIFTSHANGENPRGSVAESVMYDAMQKVQVKAFHAITKGRYLGRKKYYTIWEEGAKSYWGNVAPQDSRKETDNELKDNDTTTNHTE